jgi:hypothetical protein
MAHRVVLDANVLWSPQLRNLLLQIAVREVIEVFWTDRIVEEWLRNIESRQREHIKARTLPLMARHFPNARLFGFDHAEPVGRTNAKDRHVAAASMHVAPSVLLTWNTRHFDREELARHSVDVRTPDALLVELHGLSPGHIFDIVKEAQANLTHSAPTWGEYLSVLSRSNLSGFVECLAAADLTHEVSKASENENATEIRAESDGDPGLVGAGRRILPDHRALDDANAEGVAEA